MNFASHASEGFFGSIVGLGRSSDEITRFVTSGTWDLLSRLSFCVLESFTEKIAFRLGVVKPKPKKSQQPIKRKERTFKNQWKLKVKTTKLLERRENGSDRKWREFFGPIRKVKKIQSNSGWFWFSFSYKYSDKLGLDEAVKIRCGYFAVFCYLITQLFFNKTNQVADMEELNSAHHD